MALWNPFDAPGRNAADASQAANFSEAANQAGDRHAIGLAAQLAGNSFRFDRLAVLVRDLCCQSVYFVRDRDERIPKQSPRSGIRHSAQ